MGPQRTPRRSVAARHQPSPRRHNMLLRSMVRTQTAPVPTRANETHPFQEAYRFSSVANTSSGNLIQRHPSLGPEISHPPFFANPIAAPSQNHSHIQGTQHRIHQDSRSSSVVPLLANSSGSDPSLNDLSPLGELPSKPTIPAEFMTLVDQRFVEYLDIFHTRSRRLFDEQKATLECTKKKISLVAQQCIDFQAIIHLRKEVERLEHCCPYCKDLAWKPHILACGHTVCSRCISNKRQEYVVSGRIFHCPVCWFPVCRKPNPSISIQSGVERIATDLDIVSPPLHSLAWPERH